MPLGNRRSSDSSSIDMSECDGETSVGTVLCATQISDDDDGLANKSSRTSSDNDVLSGELEFEASISL